jgi:hypothetical protein
VAGVALVGVAAGQPRIRVDRRAEVGAG